MKFSDLNSLYNCRSHFSISKFGVSEFGVYSHVFIYFCLINIINFLSFFLFCFSFPFSPSLPLSFFSPSLPLFLPLSLFPFLLSFLFYYLAKIRLCWTPVHSSEPYFIKCISRQVLEMMFLISKSHHTCLCLLVPLIFIFSFFICQNSNPK